MNIEIEKIKSQLNAVGIVITDIYDLVNSKKAYPDAIPILVGLLEDGIEDENTKEGVIRALAVKDAIGIATPVLIREYSKLSLEKVLLRWAIGNSVYVTMTKGCLDEVIRIVTDKTNGISRQMFVAALGKIKTEETESILISLLDDDEVAPHALEALGRLKSLKAVTKISSLKNHANPLIRKEALKALKKIT
ncbi:HEAT repeat domain-containing protein [Flavobacterium zepuense]|uniref:HEAT repeat domain-containing protein n=1 Tax=Flavobacterium zepuense TaxID=2593302 RepID=A0A552UZG6_9FLAO|nr:HEAT repeat domain-containing protein [Flavobacterium zepuense]TRW23601.1 HEAT repeat domain-containing protein [Flavobacterium zepuense]